MKVLFINPKFNLISPRNIRTRNIINELSKQNPNYEFDIVNLDFENQFKTDTKLRTYSLPVSSFSRKTIFKDFYTSKNNIIYRIIGYILSYFQIDPYELEGILNKRKLNQIINNCNYDVVVVSAMPFSWLKIIPESYKAKLIIDIGDPLANNSVIGNNLKKFILLYLRKLKKFEKDNVINSKCIIVTNKETKDYYESLGVKAEKILVIGQGYNPQLFNNTLPKPQINFQDLSTITLSYAGTFYKGLREPTQLLKAISNIKSEKLLCQFIGSPRQFFDGQLNDQVMLLPKMNQEECVKVLKKSDIILFIDNNSGFQTPGKIYEMLALKKPILFIYSSEDSKTLQIVKNYDFVFKVLDNAGNIEETLKKIMQGNFYFNYDKNSEPNTWKNLSIKFSKALE